MKLWRSKHGLEKGPYWAQKCIFKNIFLVHSVTTPLIVGAARGFRWTLFRQVKQRCLKWAAQSLAPVPGHHEDSRPQNKVHFSRTTSSRGNLFSFFLLLQNFKLHSGMMKLKSEMLKIHVELLCMQIFSVAEPVPDSVSDLLSFPFP